MSTIATDTIQLRRLGRHKMSALAQRAKRLGMSPEKYVKHLVDEDLAVSREAKAMSFEEIMGPGREADEVELDRLVEQARVRHYEKTSKRKKA